MKNGLTRGMNRSCPKIGTVRNTRTDIEHAARRVSREFEWLSGAAHDRTVGDDVRVRSHAADPTGGLIASDHKQKARDALTEAHELMLDALSRLKQAENRMLKMLDHFDPPDVKFDQLRFPRSATIADLDDARKAQARREGRDEAVPV